MIRVKVTTNFPDWSLIHQTPGRKGVWGDCQFFLNDDIEECDFWVVFDDVLRVETALCPAGNTLLITGEPASVKTYHPKFAAQFSRVLSCQRQLKHPNLLHGQSGLPWMIGRRYLRDAGRWEDAYAKDYDNLSVGTPVPKTKLLSVISSDKAFTAGHERRLAFVQALRQRFGDDIDVFGRGIRDVEDKWDAIAPYKYHVVIENGRFPDYWTEKLSDAFFAGAYPFYDGCPNIVDYFSGNALTPLDTGSFDGAINQIERGMEEHRFESTVSERQRASYLLLNEYNIFPVMESLVMERFTGTQLALKQKTCIRPHIHFSRSLQSKIITRAQQIWLNRKSS